MAQQKIVIPAEYAEKLTFIPSKDARSDAEIITSLTTFRPVTSEKNIWAFWHSGLSGIPEWNKRNICNWARLCGPSWTIRILDSIPESPNHVLKYVSSDMMPSSFVDGTMTGPYTAHHTSDFFRTAALVAHGGVYMDVGVMLFRDLDTLVWNHLSDPNTLYQIAGARTTPDRTVIANHFIAARKNDPFVTRWHALFQHFWLGRDSYEGVAQHPLMSFLFEPGVMSENRSSFDWDFNVDHSVILGYVAQIMAFNRLSLTTDCGDEEHFNGVQYADERILHFEALGECWPLEKLIGFAGSGGRMLDVLRTKRIEATPSTESTGSTSTDGEVTQELAHKVAWELLTTSTMQKVAHAKGLTATKALGIMLDEAEERGEFLDNVEGTYGELLRYGSVHFEQTREVEYVKTPLPGKTLSKGLYEV